MADEELQIEEEGGGKKSKLMLIIIIVVVLLGGGAGAYFFLFAGDEPVAEEGVEGEAAAERLKPKTPMRVQAVLAPKSALRFMLPCHNLCCFIFPAVDASAPCR